MEPETFYDRLDLPRDATSDEIRHAYREMVLRFHPDRNINPGETELFMGVQEAFENLTDPDRKAEYDSNLPSWAIKSDPIIVSTIYSQKTLTNVPEPQLIYLLLKLAIHPEEANTERPPLNLCLVLDCSTSMQGARLDSVKATAIELIRQLQDKDIFSIVKFNDRAEVVLPANRRLDNQNAELRIQILQSGGGTEIFQGLDFGMREVRTFWNTKQINHIILITDGRTYGDEENCLQLADQAQLLHVGISALGIGNKWNDSFLDTLTAKTGGSSRYIFKGEDIRQFTIEKVVGLAHIYADQVTFHFETPLEVSLSYAFRLHPDITPLGTSSPLVMGAVPYESSQSLLLEFLVKSIPANTEEVVLAQGRLSYLVPGHLEKISYIRRLVLKRPISEDFDISPPPAAIMHAMSRLILYRMQEKARADMARGDVKNANRHLQYLATHLLAQGQRDLAKSVLSEVAHIQNNKSFSEDGEKRIKYGTRSLLLPPGIEEMLR